MTEQTTPTNCKHPRIAGDNYGETCLECGEKISGYGYGGWFGVNFDNRLQCIHRFVAAGDGEDAGKICIYCQMWQSELPNKGQVTHDTQI